MKSLQIVAHTTGGEVKGAPEQVTERDYETIRANIKASFGSPYMEFNTENGVAIIPWSQILYIEIVVY